MISFVSKFSLKLPATIPDKETVWCPTTTDRGKVKYPDRNLSWYIPLSPPHISHALAWD
jgi:hypothetical protein